MKTAFILVATLVAAFGIVSWWALESGGVAVIETQTPEGRIRTTHVWFTEPGEELWIEAGSPENPWFQDIQHNPVLRFSANGRSERYIARPVDASSGHGRIRTLIRDKYGFRDRWVGLLADTSRSVAVRLLPSGEDSGSVAF